MYQLERIREAAAGLRAVVPEGVHLFYSLKANPHPQVVRELTELGFRAEVSSVGELRIALDAGQRPDNCLYTGPGKTDGEVAEALDSGVRLFSVESVTDHRRVAGLAEQRGVTVRCLVRLNAADTAASPGLRMTGTASQFGIDAERVGALWHSMRDRTAAPVWGAHVFSASNIEDEDSLGAELTIGIRAVVRAAATIGREPALVDLGGGFGAPFARSGTRAEYPNLRAELTRTLDQELSGWRDGRPEVAFESGRYLVAECGTMLCTVTDVKESRGRTYVVLDAGTNVLGGLPALGRLLPAKIEPFLLDGTSRTDDVREVHIVGPLCTSLDLLARSVTMAVPEPGDVVAVPNVGAYGFTASLMGFLSRPMAAAVVLDGSETVSATRYELREVPL
ncbi:type III PLP-dependent enzyme [Streptomyces sp. Wh19]|uniref:type III PLP-dependent enzyme n=1 Tax=Streptomyces sp. Wh19 TaxID=3076629 RepID=UPI002958D85A|nr:type III PLP-dependent enzyme [Streptomyces sp. Wh19]MDV9194475.1 type III PLP-dependent enzyme [Streptomyces sp. Wh19]